MALKPASSSITDLEAMRPLLLRGFPNSFLLIGTNNWLATLNAYQEAQIWPRRASAIKGIHRHPCGHTGAVRAHSPVVALRKKKQMKNPDRKTVSRLEDLPNVGKAMANKLQYIGIDNPRELIGKEPFELYEELCAKSGKRHDPCVIDVFMSVIYFMEGGEPLPWWSFTDIRKMKIAKK